MGESCSSLGGRRSSRRNPQPRSAPIEPLALVVLFTLAAAGCASAPPPPKGWSGPFTAPVVLERAVAAAGGARAVAPPERARTRSRVILHPPDGTPIEGELLSWSEGVTRERRELVTDDGHRLVQVVDGERSLELEDGVPTKRDLGPDAAVRRRYRGLLAEFASGDPAAVALAADPAADPTREIVLERRYSARERWQLWLDVSSLLATRIRRIVDPGGKSGDVDHAGVDEELLSAHERFGERVLPRHQVNWRDGRRLMEGWVLEYEEDVEIDPELFRFEEAR